MPTEPWPCWSCRHRGEKQTSGVYLCERPVSTAVSIPEAWALKSASRVLGTEKQLRGESKNDRPDCNVSEAA